MSNLYKTYTIDYDVVEAGKASKRQRALYRQCGCPYGRSCCCNANSAEPPKAMLMCGKCENCKKNQRGLKRTGRLGRRKCTSPPIEEGDWMDFRVGRSSVRLHKTQVNFFRKVSPDLLAHAVPEDQGSISASLSSELPSSGDMGSSLVESSSSFSEASDLTQDAEAATWDQRMVQEQATRLGIDLSGKLDSMGDVALLHVRLTRAAQRIRSNELRKQVGALDQELEELRQMLEKLLAQSASQNASKTDYVDTMVAHGTWQRVTLQAAVELHREKIGKLEAARAEMMEELTALRHGIRELAAETIQTYASVFLDRTRARRERERQERVRKDAASTVVQCTYRGRLGRRRAKRVLLAKQGRAAAVIQKIARGYVARGKVQILQVTRREEQLGDHAAVIQNWFRRRLSRKLLRIVKKQKEVEEQQETNNRQAETIQRVVRGHQSRKESRQRRTELSLAPRVRHLAKRYIARGDLFSFLQAVNQDYEQHMRQQAELRRLEMENAVTFIQEVLGFREESLQRQWKEWEEQKRTMKPTTRAIRHYLGQGEGKNDVTRRPGRLQAIKKPKARQPGRPRPKNKGKSFREPADPRKLPRQIQILGLPPKAAVQMSSEAPTNSKRKRDATQALIREARFSTNWMATEIPSLDAPVDHLLFHTMLRQHIQHIKFGDPDATLEAKFEHFALCAQATLKIAAEEESLQRAAPLVQALKGHGINTCAQVLRSVQDPHDGVVEEILGEESFGIATSLLNRVIKILDHVRPSSVQDQWRKALANLPSDALEESLEGTTVMVPPKSAPNVPQKAVAALKRSTTCETGFRSTSSSNQVIVHSEEPGEDEVKSIWNESSAIPSTTTVADWLQPMGLPSRFASDLVQARPNTADLAQLGANKRDAFNDTLRPKTSSGSGAESKNQSKHVSREQHANPPGDQDVPRPSTAGQADTYVTRVLHDQLGEEELEAADAHAAGENETIGLHQQRPQTSCETRATLLLNEFEATQELLCKPGSPASRGIGSWSGSRPGSRAESRRSSSSRPSSRSSCSRPPSRASYASTVGTVNWNSDTPIVSEDTGTTHIWNMETDEVKTVEKETPAQAPEPFDGEKLLQHLQKQSELLSADDSVHLMLTQIIFTTTRADGSSLEDFVQHLKLLDPDARAEQQEIVRQRYRRAAEAAKPLAETLENGGFSLVSHLAACAIESFGIPPDLAQRMREVHAGIVKPFGNVGAVERAFDSRYQRSASAAPVHEPMVVRSEQTRRSMREQARQNPSGTAASGTRREQLLHRVLERGHKMAKLHVLPSSSEAAGHDPISFWDWKASAKIGLDTLVVSANEAQAISEWRPTLAHEP